MRPGRMRIGRRGEVDGARVIGRDDRRQKRHEPPGGDQDEADQGRG